MGSGIELANIQAEKTKKFRGLDISQGLSRINKLSSKVSQQYKPILQAVKELLECFQNDTSEDSEQRSKNLSKLILYRHIALLESLTKDSETWKSVSEFVKNSILGDIDKLADEQSVEDHYQVYKEINDAITKALKKWQKQKSGQLSSSASNDNSSSPSEKTKTSKSSKSSPTEKSTLDKSKDSKSTNGDYSKIGKKDKDGNIDIPLDDNILEEKSQKLIDSKEYKDFLNELNGDFEDFIKKYDTYQENLNKKALPKKDLKIDDKKKKPNLISKVIGVDKPKKEKLKDIMSNFPFKMKDIKKGLAKSFKIIAAGGATIIGAFFTAKFYKRAFNFIKSGVLAGAAAIGNMMKGFLNLFGKGPIMAIFGILFLPIKILIKAITFVLKPLIGLIKGLAGIILKPIKVLLGGVFKILKGFAGLVVGLVGGLLKFAQSKTIGVMVKLFFSSPSGAFMLGYIVGWVWIKMIKPAYDWIVNIVNRIKGIINGVSDFVSNLLNPEGPSVFDKDAKFEPGTFSYKVNRFVKEVYKLWEGLTGFFKVTLKGPIDMFKGALEWIESQIPLFTLIKETLRSEWAKKAEELIKFVIAATFGPAGKILGYMSGVWRVVGTVVALLVQGIRSMISIWWGNKPKVDFTPAFKAELNIKSEKRIAYLSGDQKTEYKELMTGVNAEEADIASLENDLKEAYKVLEKDKSSWTTLPSLIKKITTSHVLGTNNPEVIPLDKKFATLPFEAQYKLLTNIINKRKTRAGQIHGILQTNDKNQVVNLLKVIKESPEKLNFTFVDKNVKSENKPRSFDDTLVQIEKSGSDSYRALTVTKDGKKVNLIDLATMAKKSGKNSIELKKSDLIKEQFNAMKQSGLISGDWGSWDSDVDIALDKDKIAAYIEQLKQNRQTKLIDNLKNSSLFNNIDAGKRKKMNDAIKQYFNDNDIQNMKDNEIIAQMSEILKQIKDGNKNLPTPVKTSERLGPTVERAQKLAQESEKVENGKNTAIFTKNPTSSKYVNYSDPYSTNTAANPPT